MGRNDQGWKKDGAYNNRNGPERIGMGLHNRNGHQN